jgi:ankyrin repeat protein
MFAVWQDQMEIVELLVDRGADLDGRTASEVPLINIAAEVGSTQMLAYLLEKGADVDARGGTMHALSMKWDDHDQTPLIWAVRLKQADAVRFLLDHGADADLQDDTGRTALMWAAGTGNLAGALSLIEAGADTGLRDGRGESALDLARGMAERFPDDAARYEAVAAALMAARSDHP